MMHRIFFYRLTALLAVIGLCLSSISCSRTGVRPGVMPKAGERSVFRTQGDTLTYYIAFENKRQRKHFAKALEEFLLRYGETYPLFRDTVQGVMRIRIAPAADRTPPPSDSLFLKPLEEAAISESTVVMSVDTTGIPVPAKGGKAVLYSFRAEFGYSLGSLVGTMPFALPADELPPADSQETARYPFETSQPSPTRVRLTLAENFRNASGQPVSAFDVVQAWFDFVKKHPAEGKALFRHVKGIEGFIRGQEATIPGIVSTDNKTIMIRLATRDPHCLERLRSPRLIPASLKVGPYAVAKRNEKRALLKSNPHHRGVGPFLDEIGIVLDRDSNPFLGFSLNKYDVLTLFSEKDLSYARSSLSDKGNLVPLGADRYFLALKDSREEVRRFVKSITRPQNVLTSVVRAEGRVIDAIEHPSEIAGSVSSTPDGLPQIPFTQNPLTILYLKSDPISVLIAEDLLADISNAGVPCSLKGAEAMHYERAAVSGDYTIAVAWAPEALVHSRSEKLRIASIWFNDVQDERIRLQRAAEIPLFSLQRYALCRNGLEFYHGAMQGIYYAEPEL